jgi:hypothetical protein
MGSPLQGDFARNPMIAHSRGEIDAHEVGADLRVCPIDTVVGCSRYNGIA